MPDILDQLSPHIVQDILKGSCVDIAKFESYKWHKALHEMSAQATKFY